jgi:AcrR family transcriptional regulator
MIRLTIRSGAFLKAAKNGRASQQGGKSMQATQTMQDTRSRILETAEHFLRTRGYSGFSYGDIADAVGTTKANVHHHFGTKADLSNLLLVKTKEEMIAVLDEFQNRSALDKLK